MIGILGAGALGRLWAALLPEGESAFLPRPGMDPAAPPVRYTFASLDGRQTIMTRSWLASGTQPDLVLVATKAGDTLEALTPWVSNLPTKVPILLLQNGLGSQQAVANAWPTHPILAASTTEGANRPTPNKVIHAGSGDTWIGPLTAPGKNHLDSVVTELRASGLRVHEERDILHRLWQKLVVNAGINPFTAILDCANGEILSDPFFLTQIDPLCNEIAAIMQAEGIGKAKPKELRDRIETVARNTARNTSSMRADRLAGRKTEIDYINGYLARLGQQLKIPVPVNQSLTDRVKQLSE
ncbi:MAG: 2-dehydropantoate 2-reductase [Gammaproteobacteria bacterium]|nr:MAG: 2-dehydropantoate 2-reductase [Gammaproteobacteria bacterium]